MYKIASPVACGEEGMEGEGQGTGRQGIMKGKGRRKVRGSEREENRKGRGREKAIELKNGRVGKEIQVSGNFYTPVACEYSKCILLHYS